MSKKKYILISRILLSCSLIFLSVGSFAENPVLPIEIKKTFDGCKQINNFYKMYPDVRRPLYAYGFLGDKNDNFIDAAGSEHVDRDSFVAWCEGEPDGLRKYYLKLYFGGGVEPSCPSLIGPFKNIGGILIDKESTEPLSWYSYFSPVRGEPVKLEGKTGGNIIESSYDGMGYRFYCHDGQWLFRVIH